jgi:drug/metabolite transporter (DMT)-like permease
LPLVGLRRNAAAANAANGRLYLSGGLLAGTVLFAGATLQQAGMVHTTAGKGGFITGLYVVFVPILGLLVGHRTALSTWVGVVLAAIACTR